MTNHSIQQSGTSYTSLLLALFLLYATPVKALEATDIGQMIKIPEGPFIMGSSAEDVEWAALKFFSESLEWYQDEMPQQEVVLTTYYIDKYETTVGQYRPFIKSTRRLSPRYWQSEKFNAEIDHPVVGVSWEDARAYCDWVGKRLPTEAEWEKAARGDQGLRYPWGDEPEEMRLNARGKDAVRYTSAVGSFPEGKSPYGVMDMSGNVWEWTSDWYLPYPDNQTENDMYGEQFKIIRGGSWNANLDLARTTVRGKSLPDQQQNSVGFRCARNP